MLVAVPMAVLTSVVLRMERERVAVPAIVPRYNQLIVVVVDGVAGGALHDFGMKLLVVAIATRPLHPIEVVRPSSWVALEAVACTGLRWVALKTSAKVRGRGLRRGAVDRIYVAASTRGAARVLGLRGMAIEADI